MKVLMISGDVGVIKGQDGPFALTLTELGKHWGEIDVVCPGVQGKRQFKDNVCLQGARKFFLFFDLLRILRTKKYDLIVSHDYGLMLNGISAFFLGKAFGIPQISEIHHLEGFPNATNSRERFYAWWGKIYIAILVRRMRAVRVDNWGAIVPLLKSLGVAEKNLIYLPPIYLDLEIYRPIQLDKKFDILFVGRLAQNKGIFTILEAVKSLKEAGLILRTNIKGRGPLKESVKEFIERNSMADYVTLDERILNEEDLAVLYNQSKVLVCASTVEGGPRVTLEAMACGVPVISTPCGIMPEVIKNGENGYLFDGSRNDLGEKLRLLFTNQSSFCQNGLQFRKSVLKYDYQITLKNYATAYDKIVTSISL
jgi:glycosyltransferase involved in cell wall biosynthesis